MTCFRLGIGVVLLALVLGGCTRYELYEPGTVVEIEDDRSAVLDQQDVVVETKVVDEIITEYRVGPGDVLSVSVPGLFGRNVNTGRNGQEQTEENIGNFRVYSSGKILLPLVAGVEVAGMTVEQIQTKLIDVFSQYIKKPVVSVEIVEFKSQPLYLLGQFNQPGLYYLDRPTSLLHGIALGAGLQDSANLRGARLVRSDRVQPVDIYQLLYNNDLKQNIQLRPGDTIYVPNDEEPLVFVFGAVTKPGPVAMANGRLNLAQALSSAGLDGKPYDHEHLRIIRSLSPTRGQLLTVDLGRVINGHALSMASKTIECSQQ